MRIDISHRTTYRFEQPVDYGLQRLRMNPRSDPTQEVLDWNLELAGCELQLSYEDHIGNQACLVRIEQGATEVQVDARGTVETRSVSGVFGQEDSPVPLWFYLQPTSLTGPGDRIRSLVAEVGEIDDEIERMHVLSQLIRDTVEYRLGGTEPSTPAEHALRSGVGVCQDHAHIFVTAGRLLGVPCRYLSGYLLLDEESTSSAGHAWAEAYIAGLGWVGFDVSNGISSDDRYVRVAVGRDYGEAAPLVGVRYGAGGEDLQVNVEVAARAQQQEQQQQ